MAKKLQVIQADLSGNQAEAIRAAVSIAGVVETFTATSPKVNEVNPDYTRQELADKLPEYQLIEDALKGEIAVKAKGTVYLPTPNPTDDDIKARDARYLAYKTRAVFYNVAKRTLAGLTGQAFAKPPEMKLPKLLEIVQKDATGGGISLEQVAKDAETYVLGYGRAGLLADYPNTGGKPTTVADQNNGNVRPTLTVYAPWNVINWRTVTVNNKVLLSLVVLKEKYDTDETGFGSATADQFRVLRLMRDDAGNPVYQVELWRNASGSWEHTVANPLDGAGLPISEIPFTFIGSINNDPSIDPAPMYDICSLNIAHYRNSADYEESCFMVGQPTPVFIGLTQDWVETVLKGKIYLGSRAAIPLPAGADAQLLQMEANSAPFEAMGHKENQMVALGAKLVQSAEVQRTATEANIDHAAESSVLATVTQNVSAAIKWGLEWCAIFYNIVGQDADARSKAVDFKLNTDFALAALSVEDQKAIVANWQAEAISWKEMRTQLRRAGQATETDEDAKKEIEADAVKAIEHEKTSNDMLGIDPGGNGGLPGA